MPPFLEKSVIVSIARSVRSYTFIIYKHVTHAVYDLHIWALRTLGSTSKEPENMDDLIADATFPIEHPKLPVMRLWMHYLGNNGLQFHYQYRTALPILRCSKPVLQECERNTAREIFETVLSSKGRDTCSKPSTTPWENDRFTTISLSIDKMTQLYEHYITCYMNILYMVNYVLRFHDLWALLNKEEKEQRSKISFMFVIILVRCWWETARHHSCKVGSAWLTGCNRWCAQFLNSNSYKNWRWWSVGSSHGFRIGKTTWWPGGGL
jgi:hypothetical protein